MNREDRIRLYVNVQFMVDNILVDDILNHAYQENLISNEQREEILGQTTKENKVKKLLRSLPFDREDCFKLFMSVLSSGAHKHVAEQILLTDASQHPNLPDNLLPLPKEVSLESTVEDLQRQLGDIRELVLEGINIVKSGPEYRNIKRVDHIDGVVRRSGVTDDVAVVYYRDIIGGEFIQGKSNNAAEFAWHVSESRHIARLIGTDIVKYAISSLSSAENTPRVLLEPARCMRTMVDKVISDNPEDFRKMITDLLQNVQLDNVFATLKAVANEVIGDNVNWGRIIAIYAFAAWMAKYFASIGNSNLAYTVGEFIGYYVSEELGNWIDKNGGWVGCGICALVSY